MKSRLLGAAHAGILSLGLVIISLSPVPVEAAIVPIANPGFDYIAVTGSNAGTTNPVDTFTLGFGAGVTLYDSSVPASSDCSLGGCFVDGTANVFGWTGIRTSTNIVGVSNLPSDAWAGTLTPDEASGTVGGSSNGSAGAFTQVVSGALNPNTPYKLTVQLYERIALPVPQTILVQLRSGGIDLGGILTIDPFVDGASLATLIYTSDSSVAANSDLEILLGAAASTGRIQINFDNVVLEAVPIPAAAWLFGSALLGLTGLARKKAV